MENFVAYPQIGFQRKVERVGKKRSNENVVQLLNSFCIIF